MHGSSSRRPLNPRTAHGSGQSPKRVLSLLGVSLLGLTPLVSLGCSNGDGPLVLEPKTLTKTRMASRVVVPADLSATSEDRFGNPFAPAKKVEPEAPAGGYEWDVPASWVEVAPRSQFRMVDFQVAGVSTAECYVTKLPGGAGGVIGNINRWASTQLGLPPLTEADVALLPRHSLLGREGVLFEADGDFSGVGGASLEQARMMGLVLEDPMFTLFVKMTGPRDLVLAERQAFLDFAASLRESEDPPSGNSAAPAAPGAGGGGFGFDEIDYELPEGWTRGGPRPMRLMSFVTADGGDVSVSTAGGTLDQNLTRWYGQVGLAPPQGAAILGLERIPVLGRSSIVVDVEGDFTGMGDQKVPDQRLLGIIVPLEANDESLFVKMVGDRELVGAERERLLAFARSMTKTPESQATTKGR
ncbi:hypothetical protein [Engelhardtia mirabilis]|uniref:Uncharacterized protein n=1 Tax=Engelhardtia mirabilis TaxID=2528011 RepID=A0A518BJS4_9BACT|nr:hypothetical protein Pla133_22610 [Planctomycetes bacterium Pla133]QDV01510.1 hypothetical protein Pla86_22610 [Planctomycetes bacterium Pla86]